MGKAPVNQFAIWKINDFKTQISSGKKVCIITSPPTIYDLSVGSKIGSPKEIEIGTTDEPIEHLIP
jgi:hypothetical protein